MSVSKAHAVADTARGKNTERAKELHTDTDTISCSMTSQLAGGAHNHLSKGVDAAAAAVGAMARILTKSEHN